MRSQTFIIRVAFKMWSLSNESINFIHLNKADDGNVEEGLVDQTWDGICSLMMNHHERADKDGACFIPARMKPREQWVLSKSKKTKKPTYRNDANIEAITMVVLDLDEVGAKEKAEKIFQDYEYVMYSTHSYTKDADYKFRIVIKLKEEIPVSEWPLCFNALITGINADKSCGNFSRVFYYPSVSLNNSIAPKALHNKGIPLSLSDIYAIGKSKESARKKQIKSYSNAFSNEVRHFTGEIVKKQTKVIHSIDYTYDGIKERHSEYINSLIMDEGRHNFALRVIAREIGRYKEKTSLEGIISFICKAIPEYNSKADMSNGNTLLEIPEMVESALIKFLPETDNKKAIIDNFNASLPEILKKSKKETKEENWTFPGVIQFSEENALKKENTQVDASYFSYQNLRKRNIVAIRSFLKHSNPTSFAKDVFFQEYKLSPDRYCQKTLSLFVVFCAKSLLEKRFNQKITGSEIEDIADNSFAFNPKPNATDEDNLILKASILLTKKALKQNKWLFAAHQPEQTEKYQR